MHIMFSYEPLELRNGFEFSSRNTAGARGHSEFIEVKNTDQLEQALAAFKSDEIAGKATTPTRINLHVSGRKVRGYEDWRARNMKLLRVDIPTGTGDAFDAQEAQERAA